MAGGAGTGLAAGGRTGDLPLYLSFNPDGSEGVTFWYEKAHARYGYQWIHPVHEVLKWVGEGVPGPTVTVEGMQLGPPPRPHKVPGTVPASSGAVCGGGPGG